MVTQTQAETVNHERDEGWRVLPTRASAVAKPSAGTVMLTVEDDKPNFQVIAADGSKRALQPGELQRWWEGQ